MNHECSRMSTNKTKLNPVLIYQSKPDATPRRRQWWSLAMVVLAIVLLFAAGFWFLWHLFQILLPSIGPTGP